ncbi:uncharacterized protein B0I36DRAFT_383420 [Microdochium trichocladiopsis]|uniref:Mesaconyl-C4 CoA hydratase n=1 Tax=Microdochium trichocladiopsis TaxID=1682393 RepID=A0A9P8YA62_9PEZI|nr:uncharacterized protein B0I36DRAFT_383420 [Microdochium trichocladiopsis]KAH7033590.1 hypothetical protein B0I36DRAFT_383420 [Microdochium trichocladiopsis]
MSHHLVRTLRPARVGRPARRLLRSTTSRQPWLSSPLPLSVSLAARAHNFSTTPQNSQSTPSPPLADVKQTTSAADAAAQLLAELGGKTITRKQYLDGNQVQRLSLTLGRRTLWPEHHDENPYPDDMTDLDATPGPGIAIPQGYHLAYFTPDGLEDELGPDGTDRTFNAPAPFTRRMWAGGKMTWHDENGIVSYPGPMMLRVGEVAEERTRLVDAVAKKSRDGSEMVLVDVEKEFWGKKGLVLVDRRSWIFRPELEAASSTQETVTETHVVRGPSTTRDVDVDGEDLPRRYHRWSPTALFRFSALTFNGHKIHYDQSWSKAIENHAPGVVVHGPLNLICMLNYFQDIIASHSKGVQDFSPSTFSGSRYGYERATRVREIEYRALSPLYAGQEYSIRAAKREVKEEEEEAKEECDPDDEDFGPGQVWDVFIEREGTLCMRGTITTAGP